MTDSTNDEWIPAERLPPQSYFPGVGFHGPVLIKVGDTIRRGVFCTIGTPEWFALNPLERVRVDGWKMYE